MSRVMYNGKRLIPAPPEVSISRDYQRTADGTKIGSIFRIVLNGTIVPFMGSPNSSRVFWDQSGFPADETVNENSILKAVLRKQEAIRELFSDDGLQFEIQSEDGSAPLKCNPRIGGITFSEGSRWFTRCDYTIELEADIVYINGQSLYEDNFDPYISDASESWSLETEETPEGVDLPRTYRMTHTISAVGKRFYDESGNLSKPAWQQAEKFVLSKLGFSTSVAANSGINNLPSYYGGYNFIRSSNKNEMGGEFSASESWILASGIALEDFTCEIKNDASIGTTNVVIQGTITGLEERDSNLQLVRKKYTNAETKWNTIKNNLLSRAQNYAGITLNPFPLSTTIGKNDIQGFISYAYEYNNRPTNLFSGVLFENIQISENRPADLFAAIPTLGRLAGPVLQDLSSKRERSVSLNMELVFPPQSFGTGSESDLRTVFYNNPRLQQPIIFNNIYQAVRPGLKYSTSKEFINSENETWNPKDGRYNYNVDFVFGD